ncbi:hypothetical protein LTR37_000359 [Vermiconidia calcicola]|uniref:Uncharacterized protein n=1 Tax=Vermiconidia calcicola TaxID=1690605 RepID=A0ACC3P059_9PEZI|nr:hypothetical protein LTR37_000359 [Vermiconidia calcicola]
MSLPHLPMLLYAHPSIFPAARRVLIYLEEKQISSSVVTIVPPHDEEASKQYPSAQGTTVPRLAIKKQSRADDDAKDAECYEWLSQSNAILEFFEDLCDAHPDLSSLRVPSLRDGDDMIKRLRIRGVMAYTDEVFLYVAVSCLFASKPFNEMQNLGDLHVPSAKALKDFVETRDMPKFNALVEETTDFAALASGKVGTATISDIDVYVLMTFGSDAYGIDIDGEHAGLRKLVEAFGKREAAVIGVPEDQSLQKENHKRASALSLIEDLVLGQQPEKQKPSATSTIATPQTQPEPPPSEAPRAEFILRVHKYTRESPTAQWRSRKSLPTSVRHEVKESPAKGSSKEASDEIVFKKHHRALLQPPHQNSGDAKIKEQRTLDYVNWDKMRSYAQILTTPTADTPGTTLLLHFDNKRYLVGSLAEGTQRACVQMGAKMLKVSECFLTGRTEWSNTGGLIGMILTLADSAASSRQSSLEEAAAVAKAKGKQRGVLDDAGKMRELEEEAKSKIGRSGTLNFFAPPNLNHTLATARRFVFRKGTPVNVHEISNDRPKADDEDEWAPYWADENVKVWAMSISPSSSAADAATAAESRRVSSPTTSRKRSIDEVYGRQQPTSTNTANGDSIAPQERDQLTVKAVVSEMFNSSWRLDTLYETALLNVNLPAALFIRNPDTGKVEKYHGPLPGGEKPLPDPNLTVLVRRPWPGALVANLPPTEPAKEAISYVIRNHTQRGKFQPETAIKLKVEKGPKWAQLSSGNTVENADGETITPDTVLGPSKEGGGMAVVDLPDASYIEPLINRPEWSVEKVMAGVGAIVWICGKGVATDARLHEFMRRMSGLEHLVSSPDYCPNNIALDSSAAATVRLRKVDPARYGIPVHDAEALNTAQQTPSLPGRGVHVAARGQVVQLEPAFQLQKHQAVPPLDISAVEKEISPEVLTEAAKAQQAIEADQEQAEAWAHNIPSQDAEIITLGTGSALPSKYRNVSATLLRVPGWGNMLFDCGENTLGQLKRVFPPDELKQVLQELKLIFISHMHADHHLGTVGVIKAWYQEVHSAQPAALPAADATDVQSLLAPDQKRLAIISEPAMLTWLSEYSNIEDYGFSRLAPLHNYTGSPQHGIRSKLNWFIPPLQLATLSKDQQSAAVNANLVSPSLLNLSDVQTVLVQHCHGARAVSITWPSGFKVSYSGDCRPSKSFAQIGKGSTVLIHEATFDDELKGDAEAKNHSTTSEALGVAQGMGARGVVLTHFSQRYQKIPVLEYGGEEAGKEDILVSAEKEDVDDELMSMNPEADAAETFPDQLPSNGMEGKQYSIPSKPPTNAPSIKDPTKANSTSTPETKVTGPAAVKLKLASDMKVCVAFDLMRVKVGEMAQMEKFTPALLKLFEEEDGKDDEGEAKVVEKGKGKGKRGRQQDGKEKAGEKGKKSTVRRVSS